MTVIPTDQWLLNEYEQPLTLCEKLKSHFGGAASEEIYEYLTWHGMYRKPSTNIKKAINKWQKHNIWKLVQTEATKLQKLWNGPDIPIFIFPSEMSNPKIMRDQNGKSGLAFKDKLFLFLSDQNSDNEIRALFVHEYNHVCRLAKNDKQEENYILLDSIILEGLAENAVRELVGEEYLAKWTSYYTEGQLNQMWKKIIYPNSNIPKNHPKHQEFLYGFRLLPKMLGYCVGYYLVKNYLEEHERTSSDLFPLDSATIANVK